MKRLIDIILALIAIVLSIIPMVLIAFLIRLDTRGPAIYWSTRVGRRCKPFKMPKFRTMNLNAPLVPSDKLENPNSHITPVGRVLRRTSMDELPQLFSVLLGSMSLVGPRPIIPSQSELVAKRAKVGVYTLRPGITGWAQINGRDYLNEAEKLRLDAEYVERRNIFFDLYIMWRTVFYVVRSKAISH